MTLDDLKHAEMALHTFQVRTRGEFCKEANTLANILEEKMMEVMRPMVDELMHDIRFYPWSTIKDNSGDRIYLSRDQERLLFKGLELLKEKYDGR